MADVFATIIVPASKVQAAKDAALSVPGGAGMFAAGLSASGSLPATHFISSGWIPSEIIDVLSMCAISKTSPDMAMADKGLKICVSG